MFPSCVPGPGPGPAESLLNEVREGTHWVAGIGLGALPSLRSLEATVTLRGGCQLHHCTGNTEVSGADTCLSHTALWGTPRMRSLSPFWCPSPGLFPPRSTADVVTSTHLGILRLRFQQRTVFISLAHRHSPFLN